MKLCDIANIGQESIDFQSNSFGKELEAVFQIIADTPFSRQAEIVEQFKIFDAIILKNTGLRTMFQHASDTIGATQVLQINVSNALLDPLTKQYFKENLDIKEHNIDILKKINETKKKHSVNLRTGRVTGIFSTIVSPVYININFYKNYKITPAEMTAILLHEIGHVFTYCEFISRQVTTNQILSAVSKAVLNKDSVKEKEFLFNNVLDHENVRPEEIKKLTNQEDLRVIVAVCIKDSIDKLQSELGVSNYDVNSTEMLADQYVSRQGYGRENIEIHDKLGKIFGDYEKYSHSRTLVNLYQIVRVVITAGAGVFFITAGLPILTLLFSLMLASTIGFNNGETNKQRKYDDLKVRFLRTREDTVNYLKNKDLDPVYVKKALSDLEAMDKIIKDTGEARFVFDMIVDYVNPNSKKLRNSYELQRNLETLAMNDFFVKSATLATI